jgi:hypothetical protein
LGGAARDLNLQKVLTNCSYENFSPLGHRVSKPFRITFKEILPD